MAHKIVKSNALHGTGAVHYQLGNTADGQLYVGFQVDYSIADVPEHFYIADYFEVYSLDPEFLFVFGKREAPNAEGLRNKLEIYFPCQQFVTQFWRSSRDFHKALRDWNEQFRLPTIERRDIKASGIITKTLHANNVLMVLAGGECVLDFFYLSPRDISLKAPKGEKIDLMPLVRVILTPNLLLSLLDSAAPIANSLSEKYAIKEDTNEVMELR